jgi:hypothetical protein
MVVLGSFAIPPFSQTRRKGWGTEEAAAVNAEML